MWSRSVTNDRRDFFFFFFNLIRAVCDRICAGASLKKIVVCYSTVTQRR
ncbi:unnamed protein product [Phyllotreta striolata]|uniref:Uncharacterized protein n=1 Tax=Phyllotreta striolata TaxID=444603 RepID=A0A9N9TWB3_PHYSR|nr:unnamed protein product [Phyllotreta striolata]